MDKWGAFPGDYRYHCIRWPIGAIFMSNQKHILKRLNKNVTGQKWTRKKNKTQKKWTKKSVCKWDSALVNASGCGHFNVLASTIFVQVHLTHTHSFYSYIYISFCGNVRDEFFFHLLHFGSVNGCVCFAWSIFQLWQMCIR